MADWYGVVGGVAFFASCMFALLAQGEIAMWCMLAAIYAAIREGRHEHD